MKIVVVSGGFDPIHSGHIAYFKAARSHGDKLVIALNSDAWLENKKGKAFMPFDERKIIIENFTFVDEVIDFEDDDLGSCIKGLEKVKSMYPNEEIIFANGGDRNKENIPEMQVSGIEFLFSVGGDDNINSSSCILKNCQYYIEASKHLRFTTAADLIHARLGALGYDTEQKLLVDGGYLKKEMVNARITKMLSYMPSPIKTQRAIFEMQSDEGGFFKFFDFLELKLKTKLLIKRSLYLKNLYNY